MIFLDVLYTSLSTLFVMVLIQLIIYIGVRIIYPPEPRIIYREIPVERPVTNLPEQHKEEVKVPEYEPRQQISGGLRMDPELPAGLKETRPDGL
jgi:hypothetical protein